MPVLFGIFCGLFAMAWLFSIGGPILAVLNFCVGRFFIAAVLMTIGLFCASQVWHHFVVETVMYKDLLILGLGLEAVKWICVYLWRSGRASGRDNRVRVAEEEELERVEPFFDPDFSGMWQEEEEVVERPMKDVTPRRRQITSH